MATALEAFDGLKQRTAQLPHGSTVYVSGDEGKDLRKLTKKDLLDRDYDVLVAEEVVNQIVRDDSIVRLGRSMGLKLIE